MTLIEVIVPPLFRVSRVVREKTVCGMSVPRHLAMLALLASVAAAQEPRLSISPENPLPGSIVRITLTEAVAAPSGVLAGEPLHFLRVGGEWHAIGGIPVDTAGDIYAHAFV